MTQDAWSSCFLHFPQENLNRQLVIRTLYTQGCSFFLHGPPGCSMLFINVIMLLFYILFLVNIIVQEQYFSIFLWTCCLSHLLLLWLVKTLSDDMMEDHQIIILDVIVFINFYAHLYICHLLLTVENVLLRS